MYHNLHVIFFDGLPKASRKKSYFPNKALPPPPPPLKINDIALRIYHVN